MDNRKKTCENCVHGDKTIHKWPCCDCYAVDDMEPTRWEPVKPIIPGHDNQHDLTEMAYNNGYARGVEEGKPK